MKKTLVAILALSGMAMADTTEYTSTNSTSATISNAYYNGITLDLSGSRVTTTPAFATGETEVELVSVSTYIRQMDGKNGITLALTDSTGKVLALSDNIVISANGNKTWNFSDTTISTSGNIYFVFANSESEHTAVGLTLSGSDDMVRAGGTTLANYGNTTDAYTCTFLGSNTAYSMDKQTYNYAPKVSIVTKSLPTTPEPATATLSLLALAGLASRRRRH